MPRAAAFRSTKSKLVTLRSCLAVVAVTTLSIVAYAHLSLPGVVRNLGSAASDVVLQLTNEALGNLQDVQDMPDLAGSSAARNCRHRG